MDNLAQGNRALNSGALTIAGTNLAAIEITAAINYVINGRFYSKAATDDIAISFTGADVYSQNSVERNGGFVGGANGSVRLYGIYLDTAGAVSIVPGPIVDVAKLANGEVPLEFPPAQRGKCCIGALRIELTAGTSFVPGTTLLSAAGVTDTFINLSEVPSEPLRS